MLDVHHNPELRASADPYLSGHGVYLTYGQRWSRWASCFHTQSAQAQPATTLARDNRKRSHNHEPDTPAVENVLVHRTALDSIGRHRAGRQRLYRRAPGQQVSFDERSHNHVPDTPAVESAQCIRQHWTASDSIRRKGSDLIDELAASIVGGTGAGSLARKGVGQGGLAISCRLHRYTT